MMWLFAVDGQNNPREEAMNKHIVVEKRPSDWITAALVVWFECGMMFTLGYFARPVIDAWIGRWL